MIEISGLDYTDKNTTILKGINLTLNAGEILGVIGSSGSGKTTLLKIIGGLLNDHNGDIQILKIPLSFYSKKEISRRVSHLLDTTRNNIIDDTLFNFLMSARKFEKKFFNPYSEEDIQIAERYMNQLHLGEYRDKKIFKLPGGIFKTALIAHTLIRDSEVTLLDNPAGDLDIHSIFLVQKAIQKYVINGDRAALVVSNDLNFISQTADRIIVLDNGSIAAEGGPDIITSELVKKFFNADVLISKNIYNGKPNIHLIMEI